MNKTAIYVRVSTAEQAKEGYSIQEQMDRLIKYCEAMQWTDYKVYSDPGYSGASLERPGLQNLLKDIRHNRVSRVLVYKLDRLSRSQKDTLNLIEDKFLANGVDFMSLCENFDTSSPFGKAMIGILAVFAQLEREQIRERLTMGKEARAKEGKWNGGVVPVGYEYIDGELIPNDFEAVQIREAYQLLIQGKSPFDISKIFNDKGYKTKYGSWYPEAVRRCLRSKNNIGYIKFRGKWISSKYEPIVSQEVFDEANRIMDIRTEEHNKDGLRGLPTSYLAGYLYCGHCGGRYSKFTSRSISSSGVRHMYKYYGCYARSQKNKDLITDPNCKNKTWRESELNEVVFNEIRKLRLEPLPDEPDPVEDGTEVIKAEIEKINIKIDKLMDLYLSDSIDKKVLESKVHDLDEQKHKLEDALYTEPSPTLTREDVNEIVFGFDEILESGDYDNIRLVIGELINKIVIDGEDVHIYWKF